jgi:N-methylhydantoinase A
VEIPLPAPPYEKEEVERIAVAFHQAYEREYTYHLEAPVEFVTLHLVAAVAIERLGVPTQPVRGRKLAEAHKGVREVDFDLEGVHRADIFDGHLLEPGIEIVGPAVIETRGTTILLHPGNRARVDEYGNLHIEL